MSSHVHNVRHNGSLVLCLLCGSAMYETKFFSDSYMYNINYLFQIFVIKTWNIVPVIRML